MLVIAILIVFVLLWTGAAKLAFKLKQSATIAIGGGFIGAIAVLGILLSPFEPKNDQQAPDTAQPAVIATAAPSPTGKHAMSEESARHAVEAIVAFKLAGIAFSGTVVALLVFGGVLRLVGLAGALAAIGIGMTFLQLLLGLQHHARAENWTQEAIGNLSYGFLGVVMILVCWLAGWAALQQGR